ncbi:MAG: hypothetical protein ACPLXM_14160 [Bacteroidales bacterium]
MKRRFIGLKGNEYIVNAFIRITEYRTPGCAITTGRFADDTCILIA